MRAFYQTLLTNGSGLWSSRHADVDVVGIDLAYVDDDSNFGELRVYFNTDTWDVQEAGLIYTDGRFLRELKESLTLDGYAADGVDYSEQGMQGDDYVSLDVGKEFIDSWYQKYITWEEQCRRASKTPGTQQWAETQSDNLGESEDF